MSLPSLRKLRPSLLRLGRFSGTPWFYPLALLLIGLLAHGYALTSLGFYWDDWEVVFLLNSRNPALLYGYFAFDRPFAWPYQLTYAIFGLNPPGWHAATLLLRWAGILLLCKSFTALWPRYDSHLRWLGALLIVYPGFLQQSISTAFNRHFMAFFLFGLSLYLMTLAVQRPKWARLLFSLSWVSTFVQVFTIEYFVGLELIRPFFLWILLASGKEKTANSFRRAALLSLPYLATLGFYFWWRLFIFPSTLPTMRYVGDVKMLEDFSTSFLSGILALFTRAFFDLIYSTLLIWVEGVARQESFTFQSKATWFAFGLGTLVTLLFAFFQDVRRQADENRPRPHLYALLLGLIAFLASGLPVWITSKQISGGGRWDDRFTLAPMIGAGLITVFLVDWFVRNRKQKLVLGLLLVFSIATQAVMVNKYRLDWQIQRDYYWQLSWRVPALQPGTAIFSLEQPSLSIPAYDASFALLTLFKGETVDGAVPYWFFTNDRFLNFSFRPGIPIKYVDRNLRFTGNTSDGIALVHQSSRGCLRVLDSVYAGDPLYVEGQDTLLPVSNVNRILSDAAPVAPDTSIFGPEPAHDWCYFFEKADLARQKGDWQAILSLAREADANGLVPQAGAEYVPFIEAYAQAGDWQRAYDLSLAAQTLTPGLESLLCVNWGRLSQLSVQGAGFAQRAKEKFSCTNFQ